LNREIIHPLEHEYFQESSTFDSEGKTSSKKRFVLSVHLLLLRCLLCLLLQSNNTFEEKKSGKIYSAQTRAISSSPEREERERERRVFLNEKESGVYFCRE